MSETEKQSASKGEELKITEKVKILCLHGYGQNGQQFKSNLGPFGKYINKYADLVFISAPHVVDSPESLLENGSLRCWWLNKDGKIFNNGPAVGFEESLKEVEKIWAEQGPFQGILGFSQGACFAGLLCLMRDKSVTTINPKFAILSSGFRSGSLIHKNLYEETTTIPTLNIYGKADEIIIPEMSELLAQSFDKAVIIQHSGGHYFPATEEQKEMYINFLQDRLIEFLERKTIDNTKKDFYNTVVI